MRSFSSELGRAGLWALKGRGCCLLFSGFRGEPLPPCGSRSQVVLSYRKENERDFYCDFDFFTAVLMCLEQPLLPPFF